MDIPLTQRRTDEFDERNVVLQLALGAMAFGERLDALLLRYGTGPKARSSAPPATPSTEATPSPEDEALISFVLGLVALRAQLGDVLTRAAAEAPTNRGPRGEHATSPSKPTGDLLR